MANTTGSYFYLKDALGSVVDIVDVSGNLVSHTTYSSFGKILKIVDGSGTDVTANPPVKTSYGFTNREHDSETGMMYYRARYMMPEIGRFIQEDPYPGLLLMPITGVNKYIYALNNPINLKDPNGRFVMELTLAFTVPAWVLPVLAVIGTAIVLDAMGVIDLGISSNGYNFGEDDWDGTPWWEKPGAKLNRDGFDFNDPSAAPDGFEWRGKPGSKPGDKDGNWYNPETGESLHPDLDHADPIGPHWDYKPGRNEDWVRIYPDGSIKPK